MFKKVFVLLTVALLGGYGCGDDEETHHGPEEEGCEHRKNGPFIPATGTIQAADTAANAPVVELEHNDATVTPAIGGGGFIQFEVDETGEFALFLDQNVGITLTTGGTAVPIEETVTDIEDCPSLIAVYYVFDVAAAGFFTLELDSASTSDLHIVLAPVAGDHGHD